MKKIFFLLFCTASLTSFSQTKTVEIPVDGSTDDVQHVAGKGFVFQTQAAPVSFSTVTKSNIVLLDEQMNVVWNIKSKSPLKNVSSNRIHTSANSTGVYWFYYENGGIDGKKISWDGNVETVEIKKVDEQAKVKEPDPNAAFMDKDVLFNIQYTLYKGITTTTMYTVDFKTKNVENIPLALPVRPDYSYGWVFMGQGDGKIYFKSMNNPADDATKITSLIAVVDYSGKLVSSSQFDLDFSPKFPYLLFNSQEYNGVYFPYSYRSGDDQVYKYSPIKLSPDKKFVYLYSFVRDETGLSKKRTGYMIAKYSIDGTKIWQNIYPFKGTV
ncbi:MAG: hypothetical protein H0X46_04555, partial [Bacteroidetes bacterium]|nr:hypothetical protein [Bacteroidota bacterium]